MKSKSGFLQKKIYKIIKSILNVFISIFTIKLILFYCEFYKYEDCKKEGI